MRRVPAGQERTDRRVRAGVADEAHPQPGERAVAAAADLGVLHLAAAVGERLHVLAARRHPHDRSSERPRRGGDDRVLGVQPGLAAEPATDLWRGDVDVGGVEPERLGELGVQPVRHLGRRPHAEPTVRRDRGRAAVGLHRRDGHPLVDVAAAHDDVGDRVEVDDRSVGDDHRLVRSVVGEDQRRVVVEGGLGIDDRRQRVDLGPHRAGRVLALLVRLGEHDGDRLADEADPIDGERRPGEVVVDLHEPVVRRDAELGGGPHRDDARHPDGVLDVDRADRAVGDAGPDEDGLHGAFELEVGDVAPLAGEQSRDPRCAAPACRAPSRESTRRSRRGSWPGSCRERSRRGNQPLGERTVRHAIVPHGAPRPPSPHGDRRRPGTAVPHRLPRRRTLGQLPRPGAQRAPRPVGIDLGAIGVLFVTQSVGYIVGSLGGGRGARPLARAPPVRGVADRDGSGTRHGAARELTRRAGDRVRGARRRGGCRRPRRQHDADLAPWERGRPGDEPVAPVLRARCPVVAAVGAARPRRRRDRRRDRRLSHRRLGIAGASARRTE